VLAAAVMEHALITRDFSLAYVADNGSRTTPLLYGLFSLITLLAQRLAQKGKVLTRRTAWYDKPLPTFSDALAAVRYDLWRHPIFCMSTFHQQIAKLPAKLFNRFAEVLCYT